MMDDPEIYRDIRRRIEQRYNNRIAFFSHLTAFLLVNLLGWFLYMAYQPSGDLLLTLLLLGSGGWLVGMAIHTIIYVLSEARDRAIEAAFTRARGEPDSPAEKPKRGRRARLAEDGELLDLAEAEVLERMSRRSG